MRKRTPEEKAGILGKSLADGAEAVNRVEKILTECGIDPAMLGSVAFQAGLLLAQARLTEEEENEEEAK